MKIYKALIDTVKRLGEVEIPANRRKVLSPLISYASSNLQAGQTANLNFICTHNSRRSQLSQVWAYLAAYWFELDVKCFSGGVEVTAFHANAIHALAKAGFIIQVDDQNKPNPIYSVNFNDTVTPLQAFSKLYNHEINPKQNFAAVMTCSEADENCPFIPGSEARIPLLYEDPKLYDNTPEQDNKYLERSEQIGSELMYAFREVKNNLG